MVRLIRDKRRALPARLLLSTLLELVRGCFHALRFDHNGLGRGFECGDAFGETWDVVVHIRIGDARRWGERVASASMGVCINLDIASVFAVWTVT
jgi:hypothetical protein